MTKVTRFPDGFDITVYNKKDILDCLDANVIDKEVVWAVISQCEDDAVKFFKENKRRAGIPFIGSYKYNVVNKLANTPEMKEMFDDAKQVMTHQEYVSFRKEVVSDIYYNLARERRLRYQSAIFRRRHPYYYKLLCNRPSFANCKNKEVMALFVMYNQFSIEPMYHSSYYGD